MQEIHERLAELEAARLPPTETETKTDEPKPHDGPPEIAGFWRRTGAFLIDLLLLGVAGFCMGLLLRDQFEAMGAWGRAVGFLVASAYFGTMESRIFQGRTFGKLALDIKVITTAGVPLSFGKALLRSAVFNIPYFLNNAILGAGYTDPVLSTVQALLVFGLGGAIVYLYLFNRRTRQSVHDLLVRAVVVRAGNATVPRLLPIWKGHVAVVAALFLLTTGAMGFSYWKFGNGILQPLMSVQQQVGRMPGVRSAGVFEGISFATGNSRTHFLAIKAIASTGTGQEKTLAHKIAEIAFATYPPARQLDTLSVTIMHGYDIGIASSWSTTTFDASPDAWREGRMENR